MKIEQSAVNMNACHDFSSECEARYESEISFRTVFDGVAHAESTSAGDNKEREKKLLMMLESLIARMLEAISGKKGATVTDLREVLKTDDAALPDSDSGRLSRVTKVESTTRFTENIHEQESTEFSATGKIRTADGRSLDFSLNLGMCRDFQCEREKTTAGTVELRDPLVINFDGKAAELSGRRFDFDLDADGKAESVFGLGSSSGYLAIDRNADGRINDGSELFGTQSGNGFADLATLDEDGNHWLDESDAAFKTLRVWQRDDSGQDTLNPLKDKGVGAIYLGSTETPFSLTDTENRTLAQIRASGVYLKEDGCARTLQQVDLAV